MKPLSRLEGSALKRSRPPFRTTAHGRVSNHSGGEAACARAGSTLFSHMDRALQPERE